MKSIGEYGDELGVDIKCFEGDFYVSLKDYENLLKQFEELRMGENDA